MVIGGNRPLLGQRLRFGLRSNICAGQQPLWRKHRMLQLTIDHRRCCR